MARRDIQVAPAQESAQPNQQATQTSGGENLEVCQNVLIALSIIFLLAMIITGFDLLYNCPSQPLLAVYSILQGFGGLPLPILYVIKYRAKKLEDKNKKIIFKTIISLTIFFSMIWLIVGTVWVDTSGCSGSSLHAANIAFVVILWLTSIFSGIVFFIRVLIPCVIDKLNGDS